MKKTTISDIADLAGVSKATVSRVLNKYPHVRPELRERVQKVIEETGFRPNNVARLLASDRSNIIGLIIPSGPQEVFTDPYFPVLTQGVSQACTEHKQTLALFIIQTASELKDTAQNIISTGLLDGLIITADLKEKIFLPHLSEHHIPFVLIGRPNEPGEINFIDVDNFGGAMKATEHLISLGYKRVATIASQQNGPSIDRLRGYQQALENYDLPVDPSLIAVGDYSLRSGYVAAKELIPHQPDAIFVASDTMAFGAIRALEESGMRVPDDIAIVGFDDLPPAIQAHPPLTTIRQPVTQIGALAVKTLMDIVDNREHPLRQVYLPTELVIRASCGAPVVT